MAVDPITASALITGGAAILGQGANTWSTGRMNKKSRKWSEKMYDRQTADNIRFWDMQNKYNSPQEVMKRLQEAGLNPNLVYGNGNSVAQAPNLQGADTPRPEFNAPTFDTGVLSQFFDVEQKQAQTDNLKAQTTVQQELAVLRAVETAGKAHENVSKNIKAQLDQNLFDVSMEVAKERLRKLKADTQYTLDSNERAQLLIKPQLQNAIEDILTKRLGREVSSQQLRNLGLDFQVKQLDARLAKMGIRANDPFYAKAVGQIIGLILSKLDGKENPKPQENTLKNNVWYQMGKVFRRFK